MCFKCQDLGHKSDKCEKRTAEPVLNKTNIQNENLTNDLFKRLLERVIKLEKKLSENINENDAHDNYFVQSSHGNRIVKQIPLNNALAS